MVSSHAAHLAWTWMYCAYLCGVIEDVIAALEDAGLPLLQQRVALGHWGPAPRKIVQINGLGVIADMELG